jgi:hypothetical protein
VTAGQALGGQRALDAAPAEPGIADHGSLLRPDGDGSIPVTIRAILNDPSPCWSERDDRRRCVGGTVLWRRTRGGHIGALRRLRSQQMNAVPPAGLLLHDWPPNDRCDPRGQELALQREYKTWKGGNSCGN